MAKKLLDKFKYIVTIHHQDGSFFFFSCAYIEKKKKKIIVHTEHCGDIEFYTEDLNGCIQK